MTPPAAIGGLAALAGAFDVFLIDQFGVLHDGHRAFPGAIEALTNLKAAGKTTIILTNSAKRSAANTARLISLGFSRACFGQVVSSGEAAHAGIAEHRFGPKFVPGARAYVIGRRGDDYGLEALGLHMASSPETADILLILGTDAPAASPQRYRELLAAAAERDIPALCANPDKLMFAAAGIAPAPGAIADIYAELGGSVIFVGKPYPALYQFAMKPFPETAPPRVLAIGDSIEHDIAGASRMGYRSLLIRGGVLAGMGEAQLANFCAQHRTRPDYVLEQLIWAA